MRRLFFIIGILMIPLGFTQAKEGRQVSKTELYEHFFNITSTEDCKKETSCRMLRRHLVRDNKRCFSDPNQVAAMPSHFHTADQKFVRGSIKYLGFWAGKYSYDTYFEGGTLVVNARVFFKNQEDFSETELASMERKFKAAARIWKSDHPHFFPIKFDFQLVRTRKESHLAVTLLKDFTRGPYYSKWSLAWSPRTVAHEFGHILGMDDEYANNPFGGSTKNCDVGSIMCSSRGGKPQGYQYYLIYRRLLCK